MGIKAMIAAFALDRMATSGEVSTVHMQLHRTDDALHGPALQQEPSILFSGIALEGASVDETGQLVDLHDRTSSSLPDYVVRVVSVPIPANGGGKDDIGSEDEAEALMAVTTKKNVFLARSRPMSASRGTAASVRSVSRRPASPMVSPSSKLPKSP